MLIIEMKLISMDFLPRVAEESRSSCWLQILSNQTINHSPYVRYTSIRESYMDELCHTSRVGQVVVLSLGSYRISVKRRQKRLRSCWIYQGKFGKLRQNWNRQRARFTLCRFQFSSLIKYGPEAFNQSIVRMWFGKPQPSIGIITCGGRGGWCMCFAVADVIVERIQCSSG